MGAGCDSEGGKKRNPVSGLIRGTRLTLVQARSGALIVATAETSRFGLEVRCGVRLRAGRNPVRFFFSVVRRVWEYAAERSADPHSPNPFLVGNGTWMRPLCGVLAYNNIFGAL